MRNTYVFMVLQALFTLLLFFSEGYVRYATIALFLIVDLVLFVDLLTKKWSFEELMTLAAIFCSGMFIVFYIFMKSAITTMFGVALMLLFFVIAVLDIISKSTTLNNTVHNDGASGVSGVERLSKPKSPAYYYDIEYDLKPYEYAREEYQNEINRNELNKINATSNSNKNHSDDNYPDLSKINDDMIKNGIVSSKDAFLHGSSDVKIKPEPVMHVRHNVSSEVKDKLASRAVVYELEREAMQLKNAEKMMTELEIYGAEKELLKEAKLIQDAEKQLRK